MTTIFYSINKLMNARLLVTLLLGFSGGLPLALTSSTLQAWFTSADVNLATIGIITLLGIPYTLKFLWAPAMDYYRIPKLGRRGWILLMQVGLIITILIIATMDPRSSAANMSWVALVIAFFSASQDIALDAYRTDLLKPDERGLGAAYYVFAYRIAGLVSGGLAFISADYFGWKLTYEIMAALLLLSMIPAYFGPRAQEIVHASRNIVDAIISSINDLLQRDKIILLLLFVIFYKLGDALALSLMTNFLLHGLGFSLTEVGVAYKMVSFAAMVLGGFAGGILLIRWNIYRALLVFGLAQAFSNLMFVVLALAQKSFSLMVISIFIENFCSGLSTAAFLAFLMTLCNHQYTAGQFAVLTACSSFARVFLGPVAAVVVTSFGWTQLFLWAFLLSFPGIIFLIMLKEQVLEYAHASVR